MVPEMVVALRISVPANIGRLPSSANTIMMTAPTRTLGKRSLARFASRGRSTARDLASELNVESSVEPAEVIITTLMKKSAANPSDCPTAAGALPMASMPLSRA